MEDKSKSEWAKVNIKRNKIKKEEHRREIF